MLGMHLMFDVSIQGMSHILMAAIAKLAPIFFFPRDTAKLFYSTRDHIIGAYGRHITYKTVGASRKMCLIGMTSMIHMS